MSQAGPGPSAVALAQRLRELRLAGIGGAKVSQARLGELLGAAGEPLSAPLVSSWERATNPAVPPEVRLRAYARIFASDRTLLEGRMLQDAELEEAEQQNLEQLEDELLELREGAVGPEDRPDGGAQTPVPFRPVSPSPLKRGSWHFKDGRPVRLVSSEVPAEELAAVPNAARTSPDFVELYRFADLDAMVELLGHLRATNPDNDRIAYTTATRLEDEVSTSHIVLLGGIDLNPITLELTTLLDLPVRQVSSDDRAHDAYFEVNDDGQIRRFEADVVGTGAQKRLREDVALFYRGPNPLNRRRTVTICNAMYGRGTYGAVRALTDAWFRDRNEQYLTEAFGDDRERLLLFRVKVFRGETITPDWTDPDVRLYTWSRG